MLSDANFLILDEPTNHLDIDSKAILENAINHFEGTVLYVSHDRYFINTTATRILDLTNGKVLDYIGNYDYYLEKKEAMELAHLSEKTAANSDEENNAASAKEDGKLTWQQQKEEQARIRKIENDLRKAEAEIEALETANAELEAMLADPDIAVNSVKLQELAEKKAENDSRLEELMECWETLSCQISEV